MESTDVKGKSQFDLLLTKRFAPFFWTQFLGAYNDNIYRNALIIIIAFRSLEKGNAHILINLAAGLFILPFFLFSATAGQIADKYEKAMLIRWIKTAEIVIMVFASIAFFFDSLFFLILLLFMMGTQSTFFGPIKYSIIPQHLTSDELVGGNGLVGMGTFVAILLGTLTGGILVQLGHSSLWFAFAVLMTATFGRIASHFIPSAPESAADIRINWNLPAETMEIIGFARKKRSVFLSILGISWFWFLGSAYLTQIPKFTREVLMSGESVVTLLLTMFSVGIGVGSLLCEKMSGRRLEPGLVPLGALGLLIFGVDLVFAFDTPSTTHIMGFWEFMGSSGSIRTLADLILIGIFGGFYIVPLFALIQARTEDSRRSRIIAAGNVLNALFMVLSAVTGAILLGLVGWTIPTFFLIIAASNLAAGILLFSLEPEFILRFKSWSLKRFRS